MLKVVPKKFYGVSQVSGKAAAGGGGDDPDVVLWIAAVGAGNVGAPRKAALNTFVGALKSAGVWTLLDRYWLLAGENTTSALVDLKSLQSITVANTPVFTANQGYVTSNPTNNLNTNYIPLTSGVNQTNTSATYGCFVNTNRLVAASVSEFGAANAAFTNIINLSIADTGIAGDIYTGCRLNSSASFSGEYSRANNRGSWIMTRTGTSCALYDQGSTAGFPLGGTTATVAVTDRPDVAIYIGALNLGGSIAYWSGSQMSSFFCGGYLTPTQTLAMYNAERALMTSVGLA